jgi:hypothetical protein
MGLGLKKGGALAYVRVWRFRPAVGRETEFRDAYSATGRWATLFSRATGYRGTSLLVPNEPGGWWLTVDRWDDAADFEVFGHDFGKEYRALDAELEGIAGEEQFIGAFEEVE